MLGLIVAIAYGVAWGLPALYLAFKLFGRNGYQIENKLGLSLKQKCERIAMEFAALVSAFCGSYMVHATFPNQGFAALVIGLIISLITGFISALFGVMLCPDTELYTDGWYEMARAKHDIVRQYGWGGALRRLGRGK